MNILRSTTAFAAAMLASVFGGRSSPLLVPERPPSSPRVAAPKQKPHRIHVAEKQGQRRAELRLAERLRWNYDNIPDGDILTRQRERQAERRAAKKWRISPAEADRQAVKERAIQRQDARRRAFLERQKELEEDRKAMAVIRDHAARRQQAGAEASA